jgi:hypothetical protein
MVPFAKLKERFGLPLRTVTCDTGGGGRHLYFQPPTGVAMKKMLLAPGVELLADGCYTVAPPSLVPSRVWLEFEGGVISSL